jgi:tRNA A-37 threonylcarbamoyl transferase component Bud32
MPSSESEGWTDRFVRDLSQHEQSRSAGQSSRGATPGRDDDALLGQLAVERGLLRAQDLGDCLREIEASRAAGKLIALGELLVQRRILTTESLIGLLRDQRRPNQEAPDLPRYEIRGRLGEGTSAVVYGAWDRDVKRPVALKVLRESAAMSEIARQRFRREAQAAGALNHPNVVQVYDVGEVGGRLYIVFELIEGRSFVESMRSGAPRESLLGALLQAGRGVAAAHQKGIVHRDLKPANILIGASGEAKVGDFGLAHLETSTLELTRAGSTLGTPLYMAPEQVEGRVGDITPRTDVYALGAMLYEILTGRTPHTSETLAEIYEKILREDPVPPRRAGAAVSEDLQTVAMRALEKEPARRYPTAAEFAEDLRRATQGEPVLARRVGILEQTARRLRRSRRVLLTIVAAVLVGLGIGVVASRTRKGVAATLESVRGEVTLLGPAGRPLARAGSSIAPGEGLETGAPPSRAVLKLRSGAALEAGPSSVLRTLADGGFSLASGTVSAEPGGIPIVLGTPQAEIRSEGGAFIATVDASWTRVESKSGGIRVTRIRDGRSAELPARTTVRVTPEGGSLDVVPLVDRVLRVGPGKPFSHPSRAAAAVADGDVIEIDAGLYEGDVAVWTADHLTIRGVGGRARIKGAGKLASNKALWILQGRNTLIENVELSNASSDPGALALRFEGPGLTLRNCAFLDNHRSIEGMDNPDSDLLIEHSEFGRNGNLTGTANLRCPLQRAVIIRHCYLYQARGGHQISSPARATYILYCRVTDEGAPTSMLCDLQGGGPAYVVGNLFCRGGAAAANSFAISFAAGGPRYPDCTLYFANNTVVDERAQVAIIGVGEGSTARIVNNIFVSKVMIAKGASDLAHNLVGRDPLFVDPSSYDYRLQEGSPAIDAGGDPGVALGVDLHPRFEYVHPAGKQPRPIKGALDLGAFEFVK